MWFGFLKHLHTYLKTNANCKQIEVGNDGVSQSTIDSGVVILSRGYEDRGQENVTEELKLTFYLEAWVREDSNNLINGYKKLSALEADIEQALAKFRQTVGVLDDEWAVYDDVYQVLDLWATEKRASDDSCRPLFGTLYVIKARLYNLNSENGGIW